MKIGAVATIVFIASFITHLGHNFLTTGIDNELKGEIPFNDSFNKVCSAALFKS